MVALQNHYNLLHRAEFEGNLARIAAQQRLGVMPRFALASGFLTGKYRVKADLARNDRGPEVARYLTKRNLRVLAVLDSVTRDVRDHGVPEATLGAVALAWLLTKRDVVAPVASASHAGQVLELLTAARIHLGRHQIADLDRASA
jgi:aryl-alcohol dehydrogenase-like predicted oxidoreductase